METIEASSASIGAFTVDHTANAQSVGLHLRKLRVVVFVGDPELSTPLMIENPTAGIDLPLKIITAARHGRK